MTKTAEPELNTKLIISIVAVGITSFAGVVVETAMNLAFPALMEEFSISTSTVQWITTGYLLVLAAIMPLSPLLNKRFRSKQLFVVALLAFLAGTILAAVAPSFLFILLGRIIQGIGTGIALPLMFNIVLEQVPKKQLGMMMGVAALITAIAPAVGPSLGGFLIGLYGWRSIFVVLIPFLFLALILGLVTISDSKKLEKVAFSPLQFLLLAAGFVSLILATSTASEKGFTSLPVVLLFIFALVFLGIFCQVSIRSKVPLLNIRIFSHKPLTLTVIYVVLMQATVLALGYLIPYYAQIVGNRSSFVAGCLLLPGCIVGALLTPFGGRILDKLGPA